MDDVADCLGPELINELMYGAQPTPTAPLEPELMPARETQFAVAPSSTAMHQQTTQLQPVASTSSVPPLIPLHVMEMDLSSEPPSPQPLPVSPIAPTGGRGRKTALDDTMVRVRLPIIAPTRDIEAYFRAQVGDIRQAVAEALERDVSSRIALRIHIKFSRTNAQNEIEFMEGGFTIPVFTVSDAGDFDIPMLVSILQAQIEHFNQRGSSWMVNNILRCYVNSVPYRPIE